jgi:hypothetical protein
VARLGAQASTAACGAAGNRQLVVSLDAAAAPAGSLPSSLAASVTSLVTTGSALSTGSASQATCAPSPSDISLTTTTDVTIVLPLTATALTTTSSGGGSSSGAGAVTAQLCGSVQSTASKLISALYGGQVRLVLGLVWALAFADVLQPLFEELILNMRRRPAREVRSAPSKPVAHQRRPATLAL